jgi:Spy/CpxP family protein refolding chaperone
MTQLGPPKWPVENYEGIRPIRLSFGNFPPSLSLQWEGAVKNSYQKEPFMRLTILSVAVVCVFGLSALVHGDDAAKDASSSTKPSSGGGGSRLIVPYSKMTSLTDDQKDKIKEIHRKTLAAIKDLQAKEAEDVKALLNDDQKKELHELEDQMAAARKKSGAAATPKTEEAGGEKKEEPK